jgi:sorbitol/mannitol transport system substrate-binding protein
MKMNKLATAITLAGSVIFSGAASADTELVIATLNNGHMIEMQKHTSKFEEANPGITFKLVTLEESTLRSRVTTDIATKGGQFDIMTIGMYETPIWGKKGWLAPLETSVAFDAVYIFPASRNGLSFDG